MVLQIFLYAASHHKSPYFGLTEFREVFQAVMSHYLDTYWSILKALLLLPNLLGKIHYLTSSMGVESPGFSSYVSNPVNDRNIGNFLQSLPKLWVWKERLSCSGKMTTASVSDKMLETDCLVVLQCILHYKNSPMRRESARWRTNKGWQSQGNIQHWHYVPLQ